jgi:hypothetical protein
MTLPIVNISFVTCIVVFVEVPEPKRGLSIANDVFEQLIYMNAFLLEITFFDMCNYVLLILYILCIVYIYMYNVSNICCS